MQELTIRSAAGNGNLRTRSKEDGAICLYLVVGNSNSEKPPSLNFDYNKAQLACYGVVNDKNHGNTPALEELLPPKGVPDFIYGSEDDDKTEYRLSTKINGMMKEREMARDVIMWLEESVIPVNGPDIALIVVKWVSSPPKVELFHTTYHLWESSIAVEQSAAKAKGELDVAEAKLMLVDCEPVVGENPARKIHLISNAAKTKEEEEEEFKNVWSRLPRRAAKGASFSPVSRKETGKKQFRPSSCLLAKILRDMSSWRSLILRIGEKSPEYEKVENQGDQ
ncbi:hypothetical protein L6452_31025 [Arctium lappa]|uniref:Uncharacterized protein n=1 Tax=Arctium lappa TaxID=4217 RepID=A0ACB8ZJC3_ARCLA|nr:hypothetical protein L6452_31025 [Arctium lappa]